jgi:hypothetical protein
MNRSIYCSTLGAFSLVAKSYDVVRLALSRVSISTRLPLVQSTNSRFGQTVVVFDELYIRLLSIDADAVQSTWLGKLLTLRWHRVACLQVRIVTTNNQAGSVYNG